MNYNPNRHIRKEVLFCQHCNCETEHGVWVQEIPQLNKRREYADCLICDNTDSIARKLEKGSK